MSDSRRLPTTQALFGAAIVLIGVLLLLDTTEVLPTRDLLAFAPSAFALVGLWALVRSGFRNLVGPAVLVGVALAWQAVALDYATAEEVVDLWPALLVAFGLSVLLGQYRDRTAETRDDWISTVAAFGGTEQRCASRSFVGGDLTAVFGGAELDLRDAGVADPPAHVNVLALFGGVEVAVPREWNVRVDVLPVLGAATDERSRSGDRSETVDLVVTGFAAFGGVSVTD